MKAGGTQPESAGNDKSGETSQRDAKALMNEADDQMMAEQTSRHDEKTGTNPGSGTGTRGSQRRKQSKPTSQKFERVLS